MSVVDRKAAVYATHLIQLHESLSQPVELFPVDCPPSKHVMHGLTCTSIEAHSCSLVPGSPASANLRFP